MRIFSKATIFVILFVIGFGLFQLCIARQHEYESKIHELAEVRTNIAETEFNNGQLRARVAYLKTPQGVEEVAREKLGLIMPGETSFVVVPAMPTNSDKKAPVQLASVQDEKGPFYQMLHFAFGSGVAPKKT